MKPDLLHAKIALMWPKSQNADQRSGTERLDQNGGPCNYRLFRDSPIQAQ
jgi:hypothetical protein